MQKTCLNCTHVGVCSKRMQFIVNNYLVKGHYDEIENVSKTLDISVNCDSYAEKDFFSFICARVRDYSDGEVWSDEDQILCKTESQFCRASLSISTLLPSFSRAASRL